MAYEIEYDLLLELIQYFEERIDYTDELGLIGNHASQMYNQLQNIVNNGHETTNNRTA